MRKARKTDGRTGSVGTFSGVVALLAAAGLVLAGCYNPTNIVLTNFKNPTGAAAERWKVDPREFRSKSTNTPFAGWELTGWAEVVLVGGGNSAGQGAVFLASYASRVHVLVRGPGLSKLSTGFFAPQQEVAIDQAGYDANRRKQMVRRLEGSRWSAAVGVVGLNDLRQSRRHEERAHRKRTEPRAACEQSTPTLRDAGVKGSPRQVQVPQYRGLLR